jgi:hypothetical protein
MDGTRFDDLLRSLTESRRSLLGGALASVTGFLVVPRIDAKKKRKRKKRHKKTKSQPPPPPNAYGCLDVGKACNGDSSLCCSGICEGTKPKKGKPDKSRCMAHDAAICQADSDLCSTGAPHAYNGSNLICSCLLTTGNGGFCGDGSRLVCLDCRLDADCQEEHGAGAACVVLGGICDSLCPETGGTACVPACKDAEK